MVSIILPAYNAEKYIEQAIQSILAQSFEDFELIVIDDGSVDSTPDIIASYAGDPRLRIVTQKNSGLSATLNIGIELASGAYIARMDADDIAEASRLEDQVRFLSSNPHVSLLGTQIMRIVGDQEESVDVSDFPLSHDEIVKGLRNGVHVMAHSSVMFVTSIAREVGGYWRYGVSEDWDFYLRMSEHGALANLDAPLLRYRFHDSGINASALREVRTNILFAVRRQDARNASGRNELTMSEFLSDLTPLDRFKLWRQTQSLTNYRRAVALAGTTPLAGRITRGGYLLLAAIYWPSQAIRRVKSGLLRPRKG